MLDDAWSVCRSIIGTLVLQPATNRMHEKHVSPNSVLLAVLNAFLRCPPWCWICLPLCPLVSPWVPLSPCGYVSAFPRVLSPLVSLLVSLLVSICWMVCSPSRGSCLPLSPLLSPLVSPCTPSCSPSSVLFGFLNAFLRCPPWCWMVCPPSRPEGFTSPCLPLFPILSHCAPSCFPLLDDVSAFLRVLSPLVCNGILLVSLCWMVCPQCTPSCFPLLDGVSAFSRVLSPLVSHCTPFVSFSRMVCPPSRGSGLPLSPIVPLLVSPCRPLSPLVPLLVFLCWMVCPPCRGSCLPWSPIVPVLVCLCWMVCPPFRGSCLPVSAIVPRAPSCFHLLDGVSAFSRVLSPLVSHCTPSGFPVLDSVSAFPRVSPFFIPSCFPLLDRVRLSGGLVSLCLPLYPFFFTFVGWCVRLPEHLVPPSLHIISLSSRQCAALLRVPNAFLRCSPWSCLPLSPTQCLPSCFLFVGWCVRVPGTLSHLSPVVSPHVCLCWMMCLPSRCLVSPLSPNVSHCLPTCVPVLDGASAFLTSCLPLPPIVSHCPPLSPIVSPHVCLCWMGSCLVCLCWCVRLPKVLSPLVSH